MREIEASQFYIHKSYANVYYYIYIALEKWIANNIFRGDLSRVFLSSNDFVFRRRFELTDMSREFADLKVSDLQFPFANYWPQNTGWVADTRPAGITAKMAYIGIYEGNTKIKAIPSTLEIPVTFYFEREDDARIAYDTLYFKSFNEHYYEQEMPYGDNTLKIPINIEIKNLIFNPSYKETDWLKNNRLFLITANMAVRSFSIEPPLQPEYNSNINGISNEYEDGVKKYPIVDTVILNPLTFTNFNDLATYKLTVSGNFEESDLEVRLTSASISETSFRLDWYVSEKDLDTLEKIIIEVPSKQLKEEILPQKSYFIVNDLSPNSEYISYVTFYNKKGSPKKLGLVARTSPGKEIDPVKNSLVGLKW